MAIEKLFLFGYIILIFLCCDQRVKKTKQNKIGSGGDLFEFLDITEF